MGAREFETVRLKKENACVDQAAKRILRSVTCDNMSFSIVWLNDKCQ